YDTTEQSSWFATFDSTANTWYETYYDSPRSLWAKYGLAISSGLAGVGMWALGYDEGQSGYWETISARFAVLRLAGTDRYGTAAAISAATFQPGTPVAFIATGGVFPDALAGGPAAARLGGPVLLVTPTAIPAVTAGELARLKPDRIFVLGGTSVVGASVQAALAAYATSGTVTRIAGADRYGTAAALSAATFQPGVPVAYIATGLDFPDALGGAAAGGLRGGPLLLVGGTGIPAATATELGRLKPASIVVLGSGGVVSDAIVAQLQSYTGTPVTRLAGPDRYGTAAAISAATFAPGAPVAYIATGLNFPDGLAGAPAAAIQGGPVLLVSGSAIPTATANELARLKPGRIVVLGGTSVIPDSVVDALRSIVASS
ncbi:MAG TPA: cell wall-binding repeat-containing protein, partial [Candidatus Dormibacteraeota bacterium]|nr:cell wall-binding repeat-containing protein [Candidatus Dormibacteraeota bacterium]